MQFQRQKAVPGDKREEGWRKHSQPEEEKYLKIPNVPCPVGNLGTVSGFFYDLSMTLRQWGPVSLPPGFCPCCVSVMCWSPTFISGGAAGGGGECGSW